MDSNTAVHRTRRHRDLERIVMSKITAAFHNLTKANAWKGRPKKYHQWGGTRSMRKAWARQWAKDH